MNIAASKHSENIEIYINEMWILKTLQRHDCLAGDKLLSKKLLLQELGLKLEL